MACDEDPVAPDAGFGVFEGRWDGKDWRGQGYAVLIADTLHLFGHRPDPQSYYDEFVRARVRFTGPGTYAVATEQGSMEQITGGDAGYFPSASGELRVTRYDATTRRVAGTLRLRVTDPRYPPGTFDWRFEDGTFDVPVYTRWEDRPLLRPR